MKTRLLALCALLCGLAAAAPAIAEERIVNYDSQLSIQPDGSLDVVETIRVRAEGVNIRRGLYRDFPTRYKDRYGNRVVVDFELLGVQRDGHPEPYFTEKLSNGVRINTGNDSFLPTPGEFTYAIHYRTSRQLGFFPDHDELYWNVTGLGWSFPIDAVQARVTLPSPVDSAALKLDGYTGRGGEQGRDYDATSNQPGVAVFQTTRSLAQGEGLTIAVGFPKGLIHEPTRGERFRWFLRDNRGVLVGLSGLLMLAVFYLWRWVRVGRDPHAGPIFPRYNPPEGYAPGELRMMRRMGSDKLCFAADVVDMGVRGYLQIYEGSGKDGWRLVREPNCKSRPAGAKPAGAGLQAVQGQRRDRIEEYPGRTRQRRVDGACVGDDQATQAALLQGQRRQCAVGDWVLAAGGRPRLDVVRWKRHPGLDCAGRAGRGHAYRVRTPADGAHERRPQAAGRNRRPAPVPGRRRTRRTEIPARAGPATGAGRQTL